ncbi:unnamed protein product [Camellia sinensis]
MIGNMKGTTIRAWEAAALGCISEQASWHANYKHSAYVFLGGIPFDLTQADLLAVFAQTVKGFRSMPPLCDLRRKKRINLFPLPLKESSSCLKTEDSLLVYGEIVDVNLVRDEGTDNLNGAQVLGQIIRVDHVTNYKKKEEEDEEIERQKMEAQGVCRVFQRGECNRGAGCKFSHDEQGAEPFYNQGKRKRKIEDARDGSKNPTSNHRKPPPTASYINKVLTSRKVPSWV